MSPVLAAIVVLLLALSALATRMYVSWAVDDERPYLVDLVAVLVAETASLFLFGLALLALR